MRNKQAPENRTMTKYTPILVLIISILLLSASAPSEEVIQEAIMPTPTPEPETGVIDVNIEEYLPKNSDLALIGLSMFHADGDGKAFEYTNEMMMDFDLYSDRYERTHTEIFDFGRVTSFSTILYPDSTTEYPTSSQLKYSITVYKTVSGAKDAWENQIDYRKIIMDNIDEGLQIGDESLSYSIDLHSYTLSNVDFLYKNIIVNTSIKDEGNNIDIPQSLKVSESVAQVIFDKLVPVQLVNPTDASFSSYVFIEPARDERKTPKTAGYYIVGDEIAPGHWVTDSTSHSCYYAITNRQGEIIENFFGRADGRDVFISSRAFEVEFDEDCGTWRFLGN